MAPVAPAKFVAELKSDAIVLELNARSSWFTPSDGNCPAVNVKELTPAQFSVSPLTLKKLFTPRLSRREERPTEQSNPEWRTGNDDLRWCGPLSRAGSTAT